MTQPSDPPLAEDIEDIEVASLELPLVVEVSSLEQLRPPDKDIEVRQETTRGALSLIFASVFAIVILAPLILVTVISIISPSVLSDFWEITKEWLQFTLPAVTGIVGSAMGFYFGARSNQA